jgi:hypothetical protein
MTTALKRWRLTLLLLLLLLHLLFSQDYSRLPFQGAAELLQLAMNCSNPATVKAALRRIPETAAAAARRMPALLEPAVACKTLLTAAVRRHTAAVRHISGLEFMQERVDAATLEAMLWQLLAQPESVLWMLQLPAAAGVTSEALARLLLAAVDGNWHMIDTASFLCCMPQANELSSNLILQLLQKQNCRVRHNG